ncbi:MAG: cytochrome c biogenesis protein ResB, partial [Phycisphaerae bacterium]|nr:cytochrome c biogenesis protein ResB [Phycisphaerae bacterium]
AIEVEFEGPQGTERRLAFARFPDFGSMHGHDQAFEGLKVNLSADVEPISETPITVISGPDDRLAVRFRLAENDVRTRQIALNQVVETPWPALSLTVLQRFTHARVDRTVVPIEPPQSNRTPAVKVEVHSPHGSSQTWVRFGQQATVELDQQAYRLAFGRKELPLGAAVRLEKFQIGFYPGRQQPRSFESHLTVIDPVTERAQSKLISMNRPAAVGPYTLYQSSYNTDGQQTVSFLSVSWDPGKPVVFTGYILVTVGFVAVIATRAVNRRKRVAA